MQRPLADSPCRAPRAPGSARGQVHALMEIRAAIGLPASHAHVEELLKNPDAEVVEGYGPCTADEARYLRLREDDDLLTAGLDYLQEQEVDLYAGDELADDWPNDPYARIFVTGDFSRLQREIERRDGGRFRLVHAPLSLRELRAVADRIDARRLRGLDIHVYRKSPDVERGRVSVRAGSNRADAQQIVRELYGELVDVHVTPYRRESHCTRVLGVQVLDAQQLTLHYVTGLTNRFEYVAVEETSGSVTVGIVESALPGPKRRAGAQQEAQITLQSPLGERAVIDAISGVKLPASALEH